MKLTPWYPGTVKPVRKGWYQRKYRHFGPSMCYWDGKKFSALEYRHDYSFTQNLPWRGVAK